MLPRHLSFVALVLVASTAIAQGTGARAPGAGGGAEVDLPTDPAAIVAVVGQTPILLGDLMPKVEAKINEAIEKTGQQVPEDKLQFFKVNLLRQSLAQAIQNKMMREAFLIDQVGTEAADKRREADDKLTSRARKMFYDSELPELLKQYKTEDPSELDKLLREKGSSLASRQREFVDQMLGHLYIRSKVDREPNVSISEINEYYHINADSFHRPTRARWEQMSVMFFRFPTRDDAYAAIAEMGREAYFGGNMQAVAREKSQEPFANKGGLHDWTTKGSLASAKLDQQIFSIPTNAMSEIIEDEEGLHIVRVLERIEAGNVPLSEVQDEIRTKIRAEKISKSQREVMESMQHRIAVWSMFPDDAPGAKPLPTSVASRP
ncbi:peptidylprolyl isomerase [Rubripirellula reticaptiva]|uniref:Periplasmic chaperone PpiD n=1 Tax=Rubripirellula reticaptiva TaxID=2528013 RepID=A0A5C6EJ78_9BACT|nr:peptidylprolyl isomerase [Rubripirellula reticaptiva]TWU47706.1 Peptidyl-prolyl cis-trans isomerase D [Rubripirellula reticaptiva]